MRTCWIFTLAALLVGCGGGHTPATTYYKLDIPAVPAPAGPSAPASLRIEPLRSAALLKQDRIVYRPTPVEVGYYEYHRWAEQPNDTVTKALADQLTKRHVFQSVEISRGWETADYVLRGNIDRMQEVDYMGAVRAQVTISLELEDPVQRQMIWSNSASSESFVKKGDVQGVVAAMGQASQQSIAQLLTDVTKFVQVHRLARASSATSPRR